MKFFRDPRRSVTIPYKGPGWPEWIYGVLVTFLAATDISFLSQANRPQSGDSYYVQASGVMQIHLIGLCIAVFTILGIVGWIAFPAISKIAELSVRILAAIGFALVWIELAMASGMADARFLLNDLPFRPINNLGIVGATIFGAYFLVKLPQGTLKPLPTLLIKTSLLLGLYVVQAVFFDTSMGRLT